MVASALLNGKPDSHRLLSNRGLAYGDGLFETIAYRDGTLQLWDRHIERMRLGCQRLGLSYPDIDALQHETIQLLAKRENAVVKIILTRCTQNRGYSPLPNIGVERIVEIFDWPEIYKNWQSDGINLGLCEMTISENLVLAGIKHLNRLEQVLAAKEVTEKGWEEGLMCTHNGHVVCGTKSNFFIIIGGVIRTSALQTCGVAGVMRAEILSLAHRLGLSVRLGDISVSELRLADGMFISNALIGIAPVAKLHCNEGQHIECISFTNNTITETLQAALNN